MARVVTCTGCGKKLQVQDDLLGQTVQCPGCATQFDVPLGDDPPAPPSGIRQGQQPQRRDWGDDFDPDDRRGDFRRRGRGDYVPHRGTLILVLGILSLVLGVLGWVFIGPIAWIMGNGDMKAIRAGEMDPEGEGLTNAGRVCGMIASILAILAVGACCVAFAAGIGGMAGPHGF